MSKVSVIIPVYNSEKYVEKCIRSVMEQSYKDLEIIVINDGSTDSSIDILQKLSEEDGRIRLINQENAGVAAARNEGLKLATGEYLVFVDGDDYIGQEYIQNLYCCAQRKHADIVICGLVFADENGNTLRTVIPGEYQRYKKEEWTFRISAVCSHFYRLDLWRKYNIWFFSGERGEDMPISLFFSAICDKIAVLQEAEYFYVQHDSSAMHNFKGLKKYRLPYIAVEQILLKIREVGIVNSIEFHELFVLRILATCYFQLARGASNEDIAELCEYIERILKTYFPYYYRNKYTKLFSSIDVPLSQKIAVKLLIVLNRTKTLRLFSKVL